MAITRQNYTRQYEHVAVVAHGAHPDHRLEFDAAVKAEANATKIFQGSIVSLNADGQYVVGCGAGEGVNFPVPCISMKNVADPDVSAGIEGSDYRTSVYSAIGGKITAIPCTGSYEMETTEFDADATYAPNDALVPATGDDIGKVAKATTQPGGAVPYVGFVSRAVYAASNYGHSRLSFFMNFIPASHDEEASSSI